MPFALTRRTLVSAFPTSAALSLGPAFAQSTTPGAPAPAASTARVAFYHAPFPATGYVVKSGTGYEYVPVPVVFCDLTFRRGEDRNHAC